MEKAYRQLINGI
ncbi:hypothetical protein CGLO_14302 [Colletotrichum gloeosporioides Cg-14]|uniref:Uncharacterized protein n=1 Tax=Colletotrichum gloeosporioides (strain Cg-14) TaxID=1237896 RepID=T0K1P2_COLGC|nr:hypothetical protein CGLO_14302 [Colletotrichum gloeosporioides Cg-14]